MKKETGGSAFPSLIHEEYSTYQGMTLRDYFAAKVMHGIHSSFSNETVMKAYVAACEKQGIEVNAGIAEQSYGMADAMLKERDK
jgi:hypothetical protein